MVIIHKIATGIRFLAGDNNGLGKFSFKQTAAKNEKKGNFSKVNH